MPDGDPKSKKSSVPSKPMLSIRARLIVLALLAIAPLMIERTGWKKPAPSAPNAPTTM
jgi:hypothetical protein